MKYKFPLILLATAATAAVLSQCATNKKAIPVAIGPRPVQPLPQQPQRSGGPLTPKNYTTGNINGPYIAMTFDDGPHSSLTPKLLDILAARNIHATFYVVGENVKRQPTLMRRMAAAGHEFGNHTWTHPKNPGNWADGPLRNEIQRTADIILQNSGSAPRSYRPPGGSSNPHQREWLLNDFGYPTILWAVDPKDWQKPGTAAINSRILNGWKENGPTRPGAIVLAHDIHAGTVEAMPSTLDALLAKGFRFVTISQLLGMGSQPVAVVSEPKQITASFSPGSY